MNLAFLLYKYFPYGGMQRDFRRFVEESQALGHHCRVYCIDWQGEPLPGTDLRRVPVRALTRHRRNERFTEWVQTDLAADPVDGVIGFNKMPGLDVYFAADTCFLDTALNQRGPLYRLGQRYRHFAAYERAVFDAASSTEILLISETEQHKFERYYQTPASRLHMLPPGIARDRRRPEDAEQRRERARSALGVEAGELLFLFVGSDYRRKGLDRAIVGLAQLLARRSDVRARLLVVGQDRPGRCRRLARRQGVAEQVMFLGGRDDVADLMLACDALVHPALAEAAGIVLLEALVAGLPVIVTDVCGYARHIRDARAGVVLPSPFGQDALTDAMDRATDGYFRYQCRERGLAYAGRTDLWSMHSVGARLIEDLVRQKQARTGD
jgi:UDP-glucose:(heptosyl)LPS alpha-1,3-glucosyltransferase